MIASQIAEPSDHSADAPIKKAVGTVTRPNASVGYSPANHQGTTNTRLVGPENGAKHLEILLGDLVPGGVALNHAHPALEQAVYMLEGTGVVEMDGVEHEVHAGDTLFIPEGVYHSFRVVSDRVRMLVIYAPPYGEDPSKVVRQAV